MRELVLFERKTTSGQMAVQITDESLHFDAILIPLVGPKGSLVVFVEEVDWMIASLMEAKNFIKGVSV